MPDLSSFTQGASDIASSDFLIGYVSAAGPGSERRWTAQDLTTGLLSLVGATPDELAHLSGTTGNIQSQINTVQASVDTHEARIDNPHAVTATQVGLGNVDNTSDVAKPVSTLQAAAIGVVQADIDAHEARIDNPHTVTATQVGLGNVDNTSDANKPVSTLQQAAIDAAGGGAFDADANTQITPSTPIVLGQDTGDEAALTLDYTTNKATSGDDTGLLVNQTDTNSPGASKLIDAQVGGVSKFNVGADGRLSSGHMQMTDTVTLAWPGSSYGGFRAGGNGSYGWATNDLFLYRAAAATLQLGVNHATVATGQTIKAHDVVNGTGADLTLSGGLGDVANGNVILEGNVGIGTTSPSHALDVVGSVNIDATGSYKKEGTAVLDYDSTLFNVSVGALALSDALLTGSANTASGYVALASNTTGANNTASGYAALYSNTEGGGNTATGYVALNSNTTGSGNTASGYVALQNNTTGNNNTASGYAALRDNTTGLNNTASGYAALANNTEGDNNTANGRSALLNNTTGHNNTASGYSTLASNTTGLNNTASGYAALSNNDTGSSNTATGYVALNSNTTGSSNTSSGYQSLQSNTIGNNNTANGRDALRDNTTGDGNAASGYAALNGNTTGSYNTAVGYQAGRYLADGATALTVANDSIFIGKDTRGVESATNQIVIGDTAIGLGSNSVVLGNDSIVTTALKGNVGIGTTAPNANAILDVSSTTKAFLPPRMTTAQKTAVASPAEGMLVYDSTLNKLAVYTGAAWEAITSA